MNPFALPVPLSLKLKESLEYNRKQSESIDDFICHAISESDIRHEHREIFRRHIVEKRVDGVLHSQLKESQQAHRKGFRCLRLYSGSSVSLDRITRSTLLKYGGYSDLDGRVCDRFRRRS